MPLKFVLRAAFAALLLFTAFWDKKHMVIPDALCTAVCIPSLFRIFGGGLTLCSAVMGMMAAALPLFIIAFIKKDAVGGGDIKLAGAAGLFLGFSAGAFMIVLSCCFLLCWSALKKILKHEIPDSVAFAPFLAAGGIISCAFI